MRKQILKSLNTMCNCELTGENIETGLFSCGQQDHQIIYRAHILGTLNYSALDLVSLIHSWIVSGKAYITVNSFRMQLDPTCPSRLDTLNDPECSFVEVTTTASKSKPTAAQESSASMSPFKMGGIFLSVFIVILAVSLIIMVDISFFYWKNKSSCISRYKIIVM